MCGIGVAITPRINHIDKNQIFNAFEASLRHRGPDCSKLDTVRNSKHDIFLYHSRLSILDPGSLANQPVNLAGKQYLLFNGEIYNFRELQAHIPTDVSYSKRSDTETLFQLIIAIGFTAAIQKLRGMYAVCFIDIEKDEMYLARDQFGIKPLYFHLSDNIKVFASEINAILPFVHNKEENAESIIDLLTYGSVQGETTVFKDIRGLKPNTVYKYSLSSWSQTAIPVQRSFEQQNTFTDSFDKAVARCLVSDVDVALALSGGVDSSLILASCYKQGLNITPVTIKTQNKNEISEETYAERIAEHYGYKLKTLEISENEFLELCSEYFANVDSPTEDGLNCYVLGKKLKQLNIRVCLMGSGGDELFGGYNSFRLIKKITYLKNTPFLAKIANQVNRYIFKNDKFADCMAAKNLHELHKSVRSLIPYRDIQNYLLKGRDVKCSTPSRQSHKTLSMLREVTDIEINSYLQSRLLRDGDAAGMRSGVEFRFPYLDEDLFRCWQKLPDVRVYKKDKHFLRRLYGNFPEKELITKKNGFTLNVQTFFEAKVKSDIPKICEMISRKYQIDPECLKLFLDKHERYKIRIWIILWSLNKQFERT
ncbi:asparagine synthase (glutamine-hydrolyzing) [Paracoccaceae bacterium]|nr:asparagine synthase (glutamine-hydrolyzing) [Paracoccaceae bacterium]